MAVLGVDVGAVLNHQKADLALPFPPRENSKVSLLTPAYVGVGSNLTNPVAQVREAIEALSDLSGGEFTTSSLYRSPPMGPANQPDYLNAVVHIETELPAEDLLHKLQAIEQQQGRVRGERWGARTLDLDLLLYSDLVLNTEFLILPHPGIALRDFVLVPLNEIAPDVEVPGFGSVATLCKACPMQGVKKYVE